MQVVTHHKQHYLTPPTSQNTVPRLLACLDVDAVFEVDHRLRRSQSNPIVPDLTARKPHAIVLSPALIACMRHLIVLQSVLDHGPGGVFVGGNAAFVDYCAGEVARKWDSRIDREIHIDLHPLFLVSIAS